MRLLVTGAIGFTGQHFVKLASAAGYEVIALQADLTNREALITEVLTAAPQMVVHLAAVSFVGHTDASAFYKVNVLGTLNLLDALTNLSHPPQRILLASSANIYGNGLPVMPAQAGIQGVGWVERSETQHSATCGDPTPSPPYRLAPVGNPALGVTSSVADLSCSISEDQIPHPINHYAVSKLAMENMARMYQDKLPLFFVRPFNYTGRGQEQSFIIPKLITHFARRAKIIELGNLEVEREFNDVRFVCEAYLRLLKVAKSGEIYNICSGNPIALKSVIELLQQMSGHSPEIAVNPAFVRPNEVHRLCGNPSKLIHETGNFTHPTLQETLHWMLSP